MHYWIISFILLVYGLVAVSKRPINLHENASDDASEPSNCELVSYDYHMKELSADYIIVGGGTAGSALARYLTLNTKLLVLVVEEGVDFTPEQIERKSNVDIGGHNTTEKISIKAQKEVILSSGVYGSPPLLMLSGVGPRQVLESSGIPIVRDMPRVGELVLSPLGVALFQSNRTFRQNDPKVLTSPEAYREGKEEGTGPLNSIMDTTFNIHKTDPGLSKPDILLQNSEAMNSPKVSFIGICTLLDPQSREPAYYQDERDHRTMAKCLNLVHQVFVQPPLKFHIKNTFSHHVYSQLPPSLRNDFHGVFDASILPGPYRSGSTRLLYGLAPKAASLILGGPIDKY
ncbi:hypothetical protein K7432_013876 [Basidiobolus ranarum]|uniref:Glucose-methanol-choline oxidoreductase N-terminal domain-containing protein n=1 Tax=Basidiobolus ranarum TaxID=34480 RepID=A0ABR2VQP0_9FUNG